MAGETTSDGYPPISACPDLPTVSRYHAVRQVAEAYRADALANGVEPDPPMVRWEKAEAFFDELGRRHAPGCTCKDCR